MCRWALGAERAATEHALREAYARRRGGRTGDVGVGQAALGHQHLGTTEVYSRASKADVRQALE